MNPATRAPALLFLGGALALLFSLYLSATAAFVTRREYEAALLRYDSSYAAILRELRMDRENAAEGRERVYSELAALRVEIREYRARR
jgi:hypothetical protein